MAWTHPDVSLEDLLKLIKGFVDILILASGYQSSGRLAYWDSHSIKKAFQWSLFFENVFDHLSSSDNYQESIRELDVALVEVKSNPCFPEGLAHMTSMTLSKARSLLIEHLIHALPLREAHLRAFITAAVEMDFDDLERKHSDCLRVYLENLTSNTLVYPVLPRRRLFTNDTALLATDSTPSRIGGNDVNGSFSSLTVQELGRRQSTVSCVSSAERALEILWTSLTKNTWNDSKTLSHGEEGKQTAAMMTDQQPIGSVIWSRWKARSLSYLLDKRTIRLVSGASLIFAAPKSKWVPVVERLDVCAGAQGGTDIYEVLELLLLGCISSRWTAVIERLMSSYYQSVTISKLYEEVQNIPLEKFQHLSSKEEMVNVKEKDFLEYLEVFIGSRLHHLWKLSPVLAAISIPSWPQLFRSYVRELESQLRGEPSTTRCCNCVVDRKEHRECEVAERIWCLYIFRITGSSAKQNNCMHASSCLSLTTRFAFNQFNTHVGDLSPVPKGRSMNISSLEGTKKIPLMKLVRRIICSIAAVPSVSIHRRAPAVCSQVSYGAKQVVWWFKSRWSQSLKWRRSTVRYSYDAQSYCQNFDDGCFTDHLSPLAPK